MARENEALDIKNVNDELEATFRLEPFEGELVDTDSKIADLQKELDRYTSHADKVDYVFSLASGCLAEALSFFFSNNDSLLDAQEQGEKAIEGFVLKIAQWKGYKKDDLAGAVRHLEKIAPFPGDKLTLDNVHFSTTSFRR